MTGSADWASGVEKRGTERERKEKRRRQRERKEVEKERANSFQTDRILRRQ